jgi:hypothetical protein
MLAELMQDDSFCQEWFERFRATVVSNVEKHGMQHWACSLELSPDQQKAIVHVHAYVSMSWIPLPNGEKRKVKIVPDNWVYDGYRPNVRPAIVRRNACPKKILSAGFFYCSVRKIGSVFRASNLTPGKDWSTARIEVPTNKVMPVSVLLCSDMSRICSGTPSRQELRLARSSGACHLHAALESRLVVERMLWHSVLSC